MSVFDGTVSPTPVGELLVGAYSEINGSDAEPSGVVVTRHELEEVARYWYRERVHNGYTSFLFEQSGSYEWRLNMYSAERLDVIAQVIGEDRLAKIEDEVALNYREEHKIGDADWRIYISGTEEECAAWLAVNGIHALAAAQAKMEGQD